MDLITETVRGGAAKRLLVLLHGYGADEHDLPGIVSYLDPDGRFLVVSPRAPIAAPPGYSWFDMSGAANPETGQLMGFADSLTALAETLRAAGDEHGLALDEAIVAGFSQGGAMALALGLGSDAALRPAGVLAMSTFLAPGTVIDAEAVRDVPVLVQHGSMDPVVPIDRGRDLARALRDGGAHVMFGEYPMQHQIALESMRDAKSWIDRVVAGESPDEAVAEAVVEGTVDAAGVAVDDGPVRRVTTATFDAEVLRSELPVIVDFWAPWCGPCRQVSPVVEQIARMREGAYKVVKVNIDEEPVLAQQFEVQSIPLIGLFRDGRMERKALGAKSRPQLEAELGMLVIP